MIPELYIVNEVDRPCEQHIAEKRQDGKLYYIHPELKDIKCYHGMPAAYATPLTDFGIDVEYENGQLLFCKCRPSVATYRKTRLRDWQGDQPRFQIPYSPIPCTIASSNI